VKAASQDIAACKSSLLEVRAQMVAVMASKLVKATEKNNRAGDAQDATDGIVTDAAKDAASNPQRLLQLEGEEAGLLVSLDCEEEDGDE
jgi:hypothetical protein